MKIENFTYKKFNFEIHLAGSSKLDWGDMVNCFYVKNDNLNCGYFKSIEELQKSIKKQVNNWYNNLPKTRKEWVDKIEECLVWTGYEDCYIDENQCIEILKLAKKYFK